MVSFYICKTGLMGRCHCELGGMGRCNCDYVSKPHVQWVDVTVADYISKHGNMDMPIVTVFISKLGNMDRPHCDCLHLWIGATVSVYICQSSIMATVAVYISKPSALSMCHCACLHF